MIIEGIVVGNERIKKLKKEKWCFIIIYKITEETCMSLLPVDNIKL